MRIHYNVAAFNTHNRLRGNQSQLNKTLEKLSSGYKINRSADDAAGLTISENMRAQIRGLQRANLNAQDGLSYVNTADGITQEAVQVLQRMRELTVQSLNDTLTQDDRNIIQKEINDLRQGINSMSEDTRYNGSLKAVADYDAEFTKLEGIRKFDGPIVIQPGKNDEITFVSQGVETTISIPLGKYESIEELADTMDTLLMEANPKIVLSITDDQRLAVQLDQSKEIIKVKGSGSSLFFDYHIGSRPGMIIGTTDFSTGDGKLRISTGKNDTMTFYIGPTNKMTIKFDPGEYSRDDAINFINQKLAGSGANAEPFGDKNISIASEALAVTGLSGNMFKVDVHTSVIYDNIYYGDVYKRNSYFYGMAPLSTSFSFDHNDSFTLSVFTQSGAPKNLNVDLGDIANPSNVKTYSQTELVNHIQNQIDAADIDVTVSVKNNQLYFESNFLGSGRDVRLIATSNDEVKYSLFTELRVTDHASSITSGRNNAATLTGYYKERSTIQIDDSNNILSVTIDGQSPPLEITLDKRDYTPEDMRDFLQAQFSGTDVTVEVSKIGTKAAFQLSSPTNSIKLNNSSALQELFAGENITNPAPTQGRDGLPIPPQEGTVGGSIIEKFPASVTGLVNLPLTITADNKTLNFILKGIAHSIELTEGNYTQESLIQHMNVKLTGTGMTASVESGKLKLTSDEKGKEVTLTNVSGFGMTLIQMQTASTSTAITTKTAAKIAGTATLENKVIDATNNKMTFEFFDETITRTVEIQLTEGNYTPLQMVNALNDELQSLGLDNKLTFQLVNGRMQLFADNPGSQYQLSNATGKLYKEIFERFRTTIDARQYGGSTSVNEAYTVGRQELDSIIDIFPSTNDVLTFDLHYKNTTYTVDVTIPLGSYTGSQLTTVFNQQMKQKLQQLGLPADTVEARIGAPSSNQNVTNANKFVLMAPTRNDGRDDRGAIIIDSVRGSAAYSIFYQSDGLPTPSYITGMVDLSNGVTIKAGINDELSFDINNRPFSLTFPEGEYDADELLQMLNNELSAANTGLMASYNDNFLRLSYKENGVIPIDGFSGSARSTLIFPTEYKGPLQDMVLQIGANVNQTMNVRTAAFSDRLLRINTINVGTREGGEKALERLDNAISNLTGQLSNLGAIQNRLEHVFGINNNTSENLTAAESKIRDADMAKEMMRFVKQNILKQAATTMLAQATNAPQAVIQLLK